MLPGMIYGLCIHHICLIGCFILMTAMHAIFGTRQLVLASSIRGGGCGMFKSDKTKILFPPIVTHGEGGFPHFRVELTMCWQILVCFFHFVARFGRWQFGKFPRPVGWFCSYLLPRHALANCIEIHNKTSRQSGKKLCSLFHGAMMTLQ